MATQKDPDDPKGLIRESYRIEGITDGECRSILVDWALSLPLGTDQAAAAARLLAARAELPDHPMSVLLRGAATQAAPAGRRGGRAARVSGSGRGPADT
ncbi:MAG: hypothetical protein Kow0013_22750 [Pararhodobacter sp.]